MRLLAATVTVLAALASPAVAGADVITSWNRTFVDALEATRAYEANIGVIEVTKNMSDQALRIIA